MLHRGHTFLKQCSLHAFPTLPLAGTAGTPHPAQAAMTTSARCHSRPCNVLRALRQQLCWHRQPHSVSAAPKADRLYINNHGFEFAASMCCTADRSHSYQQPHRGMRVMACCMKALSCPTCCQACLPRQTSRTALRTAPAATSCSTQRKIGRTLLLCASQSSGTARWSTGTRQRSSFPSNRGAAAVHVVSAGAAMVVGNMTG